MQHRVKPQPRRHALRRHPHPDDIQLHRPLHRAVNNLHQLDHRAVAAIAQLHPLRQHLAHIVNFQLGPRGLAVGIVRQPRAKPRRHKLMPANPVILRVINRPHRRRHIRMPDLQRRNHHRLRRPGPARLVKLVRCRS